MVVHTSPYVLCCLLLSAAAVWAQPETVFVVDNHEPWYVFKYGLPALGRNQDLFKHVSGASCADGHGSGDTAFVDTTASFDFAIRWGEELNGGRPFYMYEVRATQQMYELVKSWDGYPTRAMVRGNALIYNIQML